MRKKRLIMVLESRRKKKFFFGLVSLASKPIEIHNEVPFFN